jgi:hypothetical protein
MSKWGVYGITGRLADGTHTSGSNRAAKKFVARWRVDGVEHERRFDQKGHANAFRDRLVVAKVEGWPADRYGWPADPALMSTDAASTVTAERRTPAEARQGHTVESYVWEVWWPIVSGTFDDKVRLGHRRNAELAVQLLRYGARSGDFRVDRARVEGASIDLVDLVSDDLRFAVVRRRSINGRTAAVNEKRLKEAFAAGKDVVDVELEPETAAPATVRSFVITLGMIIKAAQASGHVTKNPNPMTGVMDLAPKPKPSKVSARLVPTLDEVFDLADAIAQIGPLMSDGRPNGERFRSLILAGATLGPRPGELVGHQPEWLTAAGPGLVRFQETEAAVYDAKEGSPGRRSKKLKHRAEGEYRDVPVLPEVFDAIQLHIERGYSSPSRTWRSRTGRGHLDWGNMTDTHFRPALERVFAGTAKEALVNAAPGILRKTAITWWLQSGVTTTVAAEWAGHTEEVMQIYYASRSSLTWAPEASLLLNSRSRTTAQQQRGDDYLGKEAS